MLAEKDVNWVGIGAVICVVCAGFAIAIVTVWLMLVRVGQQVFETYLEDLFLRLLVADMVFFSIGAVLVSFGDKFPPVTYHTSLLDPSNTPAPIQLQSADSSDDDSA